MTTLLYALPMALIWVVIVGRLSVDVFAVGFAAALVLVFLLRPVSFTVRWQRFPMQLIAMVVYVVMLFWDILRSGLDVAWRVLSPDMRLKPGVIAVSTQDQEHHPLILTLSASYITLTPGELVVEVAEDHIMYVHCLDVEASSRNVDREQTRRLNVIQRILGRTV